MELREGEVVVEGVRAPVIEAGPPDAREAVLFLHGNPGSGRDWEALIAQVGEFARAVAPDLPGFGGASKPRDFGYRVESYATFIERARTQLGIERAHLVMHDFGGPFGIVWAALHPEAFASAVVMQSGFARGLRWHRMARVWQTPVLGELAMGLVTRGAWRRALGRGSARGMPREFADRLYDEYDRDTRRAVLELYRSTKDPNALAELLAPTFRELDRPALIVWGAGDPYMPVEYARGNLEGFPSAEVVILEGSGHWPWIDDPEGAAGAILPFLRRQAGPPA
jgi:pimeloyl-ACP methyl ester carboxylesterase